MTINAASAAASYARQAGNALSGGIEPRSADPAKSFVDLVAEAATGAIEIGRAAETVSVKAIAGQAELNEVVTAVTNAELTLQTVVAVRDRVIQAYQDIIRMPI